MKDNVTEVTLYFTLSVGIAFLAILGILWTNATVPADRQIQYDLGAWIFFAIFLFTAILGIGQIGLAMRKSK